MKYIKITCSNGYCECDEDFYYTVSDNDGPYEIDMFATEVLYNDYSFAEPDGRFLTHSSGWGDEDYPKYEEDCDEYQENLSVYWEEITKEEYEENK